MEDRKLERLYDYTKFHIGIYLSVAAGLVTIVSLASKVDQAHFLAQLIGSPLSFVISTVSMFVAGIAGAVVASTCTECDTYNDLWNKKQGPFGLKLMTGKNWVRLEHTSFWFSTVLFVYAIISAHAVQEWLWHQPDNQPLCQSQQQHDPCIQAFAYKVDAVLGLVIPCSDALQFHSRD